MDYGAAILSVSSPYMDATYCKVWALNSSWLLRYTLLSSQIPPLRPPPSGRKLKRENLFLRTVMDYSFHILQVSRPYIDATLCKVWASNSSWLVGYSLLYPKNVPPPLRTALPNKKPSYPHLWTELDYEAPILSVSSPYIDATLCKVWALNSSWLLGYILL
jgi:hypothetical protein